MFRKIIGTIRTRVIIAVVTLLVVMLNVRYLGAANFGTIALIIYSISIVQTINNFIGGGAIVYFVPRRDPFILLFLSYTWSVVTSVVVVVILQLLHLIPEGFFLHVMILSLLLSMGSVNYLILLGRERISAYNNITLFQTLVLFLVFLFFVHFTSRRDVFIYIMGLYSSYLFAFLTSLVMILPELKVRQIKNVWSVLKDIFNYGAVMQVGNILQLFNYRMGIYFLDFFQGRVAVGIYSVGAQFSEGLWIISKSISVVQMSRISNTNDTRYASRITLNLIKIGVILTLIGLIILLILPTSFFSYLLGRNLPDIKLVMVFLATGILTLSVSIILSPFFSGIGKPVYNAISSAIGLVFTVGLGLILIPKYGVIGAAISASVSYSMATFFQLIIFIRKTGLKGADFLLHKDEITMMKNEFRGLIK
ncbi:MAG: polysaccharide biosynthesis C-terminal domain-containing protein [Bacteroidetes bacterium]|nr:polysaccharide biosynthesis C-terminal domain-containing protein [Bacteroidota bacterium]